MPTFKFIAIDNVFSQMSQGFHMQTYLYVYMQVQLEAYDKTILN